MGTLRTLRRGLWKTTPHACGVDDIASEILALRQIVFFVWVTLNEHKWVISRERRGRLGVGMSADAANTRVCATGSNAGCRISAWRTHSCVPRPHSCGRLCLKCDGKSRLASPQLGLKN